MRRNIFCIGDSFVNLPRKRYKEWPQFLADLCPNDNIFNLGWPGAGTEVSISTLKQCIEGVLIKGRSRLFKPDIVYLQVSDPMRKTYIQEDFPLDYINNCISFLHKNYVTWNHNPRQNRFDYMTDAINMNLGVTFDKEYAKYHKQYTDNFLHDVRYAWQWQRSNVETFVQRDVVYIKHLCKTNNIKVICYTHVNNSRNDNTDFTIENILGTKKFTNYCVDDGYHFGNEGNKFIANLMKEKI